MMKTVMFFDQNLNERGTSIATYDYAHFNEEILGNKSIIATFADRGDHEHSSYNKFKERFGNIYEVNNFKELEKIQCDFVYNLKYGYNDGNLVSHAKNLVHVVFPSYEPHGDVYAYVSEWLAKNYNAPFVPHMVNLPKTTKSYRNFLGISHDTVVVGWIGGNNFEIEFAQKAVEQVAKERGYDSIVFLFMNQDNFCNEQHSNIIFINGTTDQNEKAAFINTCDVMLHARERGETFGLAIAEFSSMNKPIITYANSPERNHIEILGDRSILYHDYKSLYDILSNLQTNFCRGGSWNCYQDYTPEKVMEQFNKIFLQ